MPRPVYQLLSHSYSVDEDTKLVSIYEVVDTITVLKLPAPAPGRVAFFAFRPMAVLSCWAIDLGKGDSFDDKFEFELELQHPDGSVMPFAKTEFQFILPHLAKRFQIRLEEAITWPKGGVAVIEGRVRKVGTQKWLTQSYLLNVKIEQPAEPTSTAPLG
ncbi:MAG: hypothetical protein C0467_15840 [Planctomycetaceae bacterium]|nr:hypothetical protein [Planctomycetaceae bacterium]